MKTFDISSLHARFRESTLGTEILTERIALIGSRSVEFVESQDMGFASEFC